MYTIEVEIYSDSPNKVVVRVPWRKYPGTLIQGDELFGLSRRADKACSVLLARFRSVPPNARELEGMSALLSLKDELRALLKHYKQVAWGRSASPPGTRTEILSKS
jgi:hypothetical protein